MKRIVAILLPASLLTVGCPFIDQTQFWHRNGSIFIAENVPTYRVDIAYVGLYWHPGSGSAVLRDPSLDQAKVIWKISPISRVQFAGFSFELFKTPPGFKVDVERKDDLPHTGIFSVEVRGIQKDRNRVLLYEEFSPESLARLTGKLTTGVAKPPRNR